MPDAATADDLGFVPHTQSAGNDLGFVPHTQQAPIDLGFVPVGRIQQPPSSTPATDAAAIVGGPQDFTTQDAVAAYNRSPQWLKNASDAFSEVVGGFVPKSAQAVAEFLTPAASLPTEAKQIYGAARNLIAGQPLDEVVRQQYPESQQLAQAQQTPPYSKERFAAGFGTVANLLMGGQIAHGLGRGVEPSVPSQRPGVSGEAVTGAPEPGGGPVPPSGVQGRPVTPEVPVVPEAAAEAAQVQGTPEMARLQPEGVPVTETPSAVPVEPATGIVEPDLTTQPIPEGGEPSASTEPGASEVSQPEVRTRMGEAPPLRPKLEEPAPVQGDVGGGAAEPKAQAFTTELGSTYTVHGDGTTTRFKSPHAQHPGDVGLKPKSTATFYVTPEQALKLSEVQAEGQRTQLARLPDGRWGMRYTDGPSKGKFEARTVTEVSTQPKVGLQPVEIFDQGKPHFGNKITEVRTEPAAPPEAPVRVADPDPHISSIANRFTAERVKAGQIGEIAPGQGFATTDLTARGLRMPPEQVNQHISDVMQNRGGNPIDQASAIRGEEARLSQRSNQLSRAAEANPRDLNARLAADNAFKDLTDFHNGPVAKLKNNWHAQGMAMQGEVPVDLSTYNGLREAWLKDTGKAPPPGVEPTLRRAAERVKRTVAEENGAMQKLGQEIEKATARKKLPTAEEVRARILERMKDLPCRT